LEEAFVDPLTVVLAVLAVILGGGCGMLAMRASASARSLEAAESRTESLEKESSAALEAATKKADAAAQLEIGRVRERAEEEAAHVRSRLETDEERMRGRAAELERRASRAEKRDEEFARREDRLDMRQRELTEEATALQEQSTHLARDLERISGLTHEEAREHLLTKVEEDSRAALADRIQQVENEVKERAEQTAKNIISMAIQRYAGEYTCERTVSMVTLPSDELKGRIIGREGRNIRALEAATGVDFIIDDTPDTIVISAYNPIRREVAKAALETLLEDGRIHPSRIEAVVKKSEAEFHKVIRAAGEEAAREVGVGGVHPEILKLLGALKYRTSYGQNQWQHAIEVSFLCGMMADELGLDGMKARRAGLLHDIGKVMDQTADGSHAVIGAEFARTHGEHPVIVNAIASHHEEVPQETVYAVLAQAADAISGARPGARRMMMANYTQRLTDLERISNSFPGVERSYAVQAGKEVRILVENSRISDEEAVLLSRGIARKIENEMSYPGQIKVTVIRETRVIDYAR
jgi:ribonucrease Y